MELRIDMSTSRLTTWSIVLLMGAAASAGADLYTVAGTVINSQTGAVLPHAQIFISRAGAPRPRSPFITGDNGRFSFELPQGAYVLRAGTRTTMNNYGMRGSDNSFGSAVIVGPDRDTSNLVFRWLPTAAIFGRVLDDSGEPVEGALVQLLFSHVTGGRRLTSTERWERTNDRGEYRFGSIRGGSYYVAVTGKPWYSVNNFARLPLGQEMDRPVAFIPVYYPNTADVSRVSPLPVKPGEEARADFTLTVAVGANVSVTHSVPADLQGLLSLKIAGVAGNDSLQDQQFVYAGVAGRPAIPGQFLGVPPGHYVVQITGKSGDADFSGQAAIDVNGSDVAVEVPLRAAARLTGHIELQNAAAYLPPQLGARLTPEGSAGAPAITLIGPDGGFEFPSVQSGSYRLGLIVPRGFFVARTEAKGVNYRDGLLTIAAGDSGDLSLTLSDEIGQLKGTVMDGSRPAEAVMAVLAPVEESQNPGRYRGYQTESDGSFDFTNVPAGRYHLFAVEDTGFEYANPAAIRPYLADAKVVMIESHGSSTERIPIAAAQRQ
ncbi:MAG: carboxypeptidase regulatory-like domain-containing protein [Bryobacteraceae bacterium]|jgi:hypothetical protein